VLWQDRSEGKRKAELQGIRNDNDRGHWTVHLLNDTLNLLCMQGCQGELGSMQSPRFDTPVDIQRLI